MAFFATTNALTN